MITNLLELIVPIPITFAGYDIYGASPFLYAACIFETITYNGTLFFSFLMTINRISVFIWPKFNHLLFQKCLHGTIAIFWIFILAIIVTWNFMGCYKAFDSAAFHYYFIHTEDADSLIMSLFDDFFSITGTYLPIFMFGAYILMIISIKIMMTFDLSTCRRRTVLEGVVGNESNNSILNKKREFSLLAQAFVICGVLEIENIAFNTLPKIQAPGQWTHIFNFVGRWISLIMTSINAIVLFSFNRDIQKKLRELFVNRRGNKTTVSSIHNQHRRSTG